MPICSNSITCGAPNRAGKSGWASARLRTRLIERNRAHRKFVRHTKRRPCARGEARNSSRPGHKRAAGLRSLTEAEALDRRCVGLEERIAAKGAGLDAKVITYEDPPALPAPKRKRANFILEAADTAIAPTTAHAIEKARRDQDVE